MATEKDFLQYVGKDKAELAKLEEKYPGLTEEVQAVRQAEEETAVATWQATKNLSDVGNARRFIATHGRDVHYCYKWARWLVWDGKRWVIDDRGEVHRRAKETIRLIYQEAGATVDDAERKKIGAHALRTEAETRLQAMISSARSEPGIPIVPDDLDTDPWALNVGNGTLDLKTQELHPHRREDLITRLAPVDFVPDAPCTFWLSHLDRVFNGNAALISFLQMSFGYSLSGLCDERCLFISFGTGSNGKTTTHETMAQVLGDYAVRTPTESILLRSEGAIPNDLARLKGARFVYCSEVEEGRRLAESRIKDLTGNDMISARFLHSEFFEFKPNFKIWIATNHKPVIRGTEEAIWSRIRLVPFTISIPEDERIPWSRVIEKIEPEFPGILAWGVQGVKDWRQFGLATPSEVKSATGDYRIEMDRIQDFLKECCVTHKAAEVSSRDLYKEFERWCTENGERPLTRIRLGSQLKEKGYISFRTRSGMQWKGLGLIDDSG